MNEKIISEIKKDRWWEAKAGGSFQLYYYPALGFSRMKEFYPEVEYWAIVFSHREKYITQFMREDDSINLVDCLWKRYKTNENSFRNLIKNWEKDTEKMFKNLEKIFSDDITQWSNEKLFQEFSNFGEIISEIWGRSLPLEGNGIYFEKIFLPELEGKYGKMSSTDISILVSSSRKSFLSQENADLLKIALEFEKNKVNSNISEKELKEKYPTIYYQLENHQKKYFWIKNDYIDSHIISIDDFLNEIRNFLKKNGVQNKKAEDIDKQKQKVIAKNKLKGDILDNFNFFQILGEWQDERKKMNLRSGHYITLFIKEISRRAKMDYKLGYSLLESEIKDFLINKKQIDFTRIKNRARFFLIFIYSNHKIEIVENEKEALCYEKLLKEEIDFKNKKDIAGLVACTGGMKKISGKVRVIVNIKNAKLEEGEILVTSMTRPEFLPLMKKAKAVITDEGGVTSHAAIVSRELEIPCIIGTKIATQVLKDGDLVEVDAEKGVVKILK